MISTVLFDINDVLCRYDRAVRIAHLARASNRLPALVEVAIWESSYGNSATPAAPGRSAVRDINAGRAASGLAI